MERLLNDTIKDIQIEKQAWQLVKFGDVAIQQKGKVDREQTDLVHYVKGEHMGSEDLHLREWGELTDEYLGPAFIRRFDEGDILYGSRRTYLRKVVIAPFSGITSNTTFVVKANEAKIHPRLLPFVMMSEGFTDNSIRQSKGSVNPYVNWKDLANYEFLLPPKDQQAQLAELLWAMDEVVEREREVVNRLSLILATQIYESCFRKKDSSFATVTMDEITQSLTAGVSIKSENKDLLKDEIGIIKTSAITGSVFNPEEAKVVNKSDLFKLKESIKKNTILINRKNTKQLVGSSKYVDKDYPHLYLPDLVWEVCVDPNLAFTKYIWYLLSSPKIRKTISSLSSGTNLSMVNISQKKFLDITIEIPPLSIQESLLLKAEKIETAVNGARNSIASSQSLQKSLINQIF